MRYLKLLFTMMKIGAFTFGGGYAMISLLENEFVAKKQWIEKDDFLNMVAIAESTPGPIAINSATYIGYKTAGFWGSAVATIGVTIPSFAIIFAISLFFDSFLELRYVGYAFKGIQVCVIYLILTAGLRLFKDLKKTAFNIILFSFVITSMVLCSVFAVSFSSILYIIICGAIGLFAYIVDSMRRKVGKR